MSADASLSYCAIYHCVLLLLLQLLHFHRIHIFIEFSLVREVKHNRKKISNKNNCTHADKRQKTKPTITINNRRIKQCPGKPRHCKQLRVKPSSTHYLRAEMNTLLAPRCTPARPKLPMKAGAAAVPVPVAVLVVG